MNSKFVLLPIVVVCVLATAVSAGVKHHNVALSNPCIKQCTETPGSAECATCCRTARHRTSWNCAASPKRVYGDSRSVDLHSGAPAACCDGEWNAACWDEPSSANYDHSCNMCNGNNFEPTANGCNGFWHTPACWSRGVIPDISDSLTDDVGCFSPIKVAGPASGSRIGGDSRCVLTVMPATGSSVTTPIFNANSGTIELNGAPGTLQLNITVVSCTDCRLALGQGIAIFGGQWEENTAMQFDLVPLPTGFANYNTGARPGIVRFGSLVARTSNAGLIRVTAGVGAVQIEGINTGVPFVLSAISVDASNGTLATSLTFAGQLTSPIDSNITITGIAPATGTTVTFGPDMTFGAAITAMGTGSLTYVILTGSTIQATGFMDLRGASANSQVIWDGATIQSGAFGYPVTQTKCTPACAVRPEYKTWCTKDVPSCTGTCTGRCVYGWTGGSTGGATGGTAGATATTGSPGESTGTTGTGGASRSSISPIVAVVLCVVTAVVLAF